MAKRTTKTSAIPSNLNDLTIVKRKVSELVINPKNAEIYTDDNIDDLKESIINNNLTILVPIVVTPKGLIISGHRRYKAALELGIETVNTIEEEVNDDEMEFRMIQYNIYRRKKYSEILNEIDKLYTYYGRNQGKRTDLTSIRNEKSEDVNTRVAKIVGLSTGTMSNLIGIRKLKPQSIEKIDAGETSITRAWNGCKTEVKKKISNEAYHIPTHMFSDDYKIYNKSCQNMSEEIDDNSVQLIFTSPPYYRMRKYDGGKNELGREKTETEYVKNLSKTLKDCYRVLKKEGSFFLNIGDYKVKGQTLNIPHKVLFEVIKHGFFHVQTIIWTKTNATPVSSFRYLQPSYEYIFHLTKSMDYTFNEEVARPFLNKLLPQILDPSNQSKKKPFHEDFGEHLPFDDGNIYDYWSYHDFLKTSVFNPVYESLDEDEEHPAQMNNIVPVLPILLTTKEGDIVLDCFSGSGTTGIVALHYGRGYRGFEINKDYYNISLKKLSEFIGNEKPMKPESSK
jgi:site-specific DNA-methyltransferase (adenine-specific)